MELTPAGFTRDALAGRLGIGRAGANRDCNIAVPSLPKALVQP
jgi:hypothetical protein